MTTAPELVIPSNPGYRLSIAKDPHNLPMRPLLFNAPPLSDLPLDFEWPFDYPHLNQGNTGTCTEHGVLHHCMGNPMPTPRAQLPPRFSLYDWAVAHDGYRDNDADVDPNRTYGTDDNSIMKAARNFGLFTGWVFAKNMDEVLTYIKTTSGVCLGIPWSGAFNRVDDEGFIVSDQSVNLDSGHFFYVGGAYQSGRLHSRKYLEAHNSWSDAWGAGGRFRIELDYAEWLIFQKGGDCVAALQTGPVPVPEPTPPAPPAPVDNPVPAGIWPYQQTIPVRYDRESDTLVYEFRIQRHSGDWDWKR